MKKSNKYVLTNNQINLISDIEKYILEYCDKNSYDITINYNDFKYEYTIKLDNNVLSFEVKLKDNRISSIILSKTTDFNILIQFMLNNDN